jgi:intraflagellar transport protein 172
LIDEGDAGGVIISGDVQKGLDMLSERGEWQQCFEVARKHGPEVVQKYLMRYAKVTMEQGQFGETIAAFAQNGVPVGQQYYPLYKKLAIEIFAECDPTEISNLKIVMFKLSDSLREETNTVAVREFSRYLIASHLANLKKLVSEKKSLGELYAKLSVSMLRYCDLISIDRLFYDAGMACRQAGVLLHWKPRG